MSSTDPSGELAELAYLLQRQKYHKKRRRTLQARLGTLQEASEIQQRLLLLRPCLQRDLVECVRSGDKARFVQSYDYFNACRNACTDLIRTQSSSDPDSARAASSASSFLHRITASSCDVTLSLISDIIQNAGLLQARLLSMTREQLYNLSTPIPKGQARSVFDALPCIPGRTTVHPGNDQRLPVGSPGTIRPDRLSLLLGFAGSGIEGEAFVERQRHTWSTICAHMLAEKRPGSQRFVVAVLDRLADYDPPAKASLNEWLRRTLGCGNDTLARSSVTSFAQRLERRGLPGFSDKLIDEAFYQDAVRRLFECLKDNEITQVIPSRALDFCRAVVSLSRELPETANQLVEFFVVDWLFSSFLMEAIVTPEFHELLLDVYLSEAARSKILRDTVLRAHKVVLDVCHAWKHTVAVDHALVADVRAILDLFLPRTTARSSEDEGPDVRPSAIRHTRLCLRVITPTDVTELIAALYPAPDYMVAPAHPASSSSGFMSTGTDTFDDKTASRLHMACDELARLQDLIDRDDVSGSGPWTLLSINDGKITVLDAAEILATNKAGHNASPDLELNPFRMTQAAEESYLEIRKALFDLLADEGGPIIGSASRGLQLYRDLGMETTGEDTTERKRKSSVNTIVSAATNDGTNGDASLESTANRTKLQHNLSRAIANAICRMQKEGHYTSALRYTCTLDKLERLKTSWADAEAPLLQHFVKDLHRSANRSCSAAARLGTLVEQLEQDCQSTELQLSRIASVLQDLRTKMWYCSDVKTSTCFADLERVLSGLVQSMDAPHWPPAKRDAPPVLRRKGTLDMRKIHAMQRGEASVLDIIAAHPAHRLVSKLHDDQLGLVQQWMDSLRVENVCVGEERMHRLLYEISKCLRTLLNSDPVISPVLWASELFQTDRLDSENEAFKMERQQQSRAFSLARSRPGSRQSSIHPSTPPFYPSDLGIRSASTSTTGSAISTSPIATTGSTTSFWSPNGLRSISPLSNLTTPSRTWSPIYMRPAISKGSFQNTAKVKAVLEELQPGLTSLLLSDVLQTVFAAGSETDVAFTTGIGAKSIASVEPPLTTLPVITTTDMTSMGLTNSDVDDAITTGGSAKITAFGGPSHTPLHVNPTNNMAFDLNQAKERLVQDFDDTLNPHHKLRILHDLGTLLLTAQTQWSFRHGTDTSDAIPLSSSAHRAQQHEQPLGRDGQAVEEFLRLFERRSTRPAHLFRDLQAIASLVPAAILDHTPQGKTFWAATAAALRLKKAWTHALVKEADRLITVTKAGASSDLGSGQTSATELFELLRIAAMQGEPVAQRELAMLYLSQPATLPRVLPPFAKCSEVFRLSTGITDSSQHDDTVKIALHWMKLSAAGGDTVAQSFIATRTASA